MKIYISDNSFSYDMHSLTKAFYPREDVEICSVDETGDFLYRVELAESMLGEISVKNEEEERPKYKNKIKRSVYCLLSDITGKKLPWGTLTGIRPTKLPMGMLAEGKSDEEIFEFLRDEYLVSDEKIELAISIAKKELGIIESLHGTKGYSIYIGIPFCPTTCLYCSFTSNAISKWKDKVDDYIECLKKEIDYVADEFSDRIIDTIYIGGGTPTTLLPYQFDELFDYIREKLDLSYCKEITVEAGRPDSITEEKLESLKRNGVTRISVNPQTMNEDTLRLIGRAHTVEQFRDAFHLARKYFDNINTDLILGLPGESDDMVKYTFDEIGKLAPDSITVHSMAIKRAAHMDEYLKAHPEIKSEITDYMMEAQMICAKDLNMSPYYLYRQKNMTGNYENTGYSSEGKEGIYNILIMEEIQTIVALGAGTVTKRVYGDGRIERCDNVKDVALYMEKIDEMIERKRKLFAD
ncbi:MAG: coproporphyrinogen dehydrogenase HemZ [Lachnospiraceae bacterium]|nr:coproporphyrinogen dehydrogenase HemZ [Lachnospiraceae bacterium]